MLHSPLLSCGGCPLPVFFYALAAAGTDSPRRRPFLCPRHTCLPCTTPAPLWVSWSGMPSRLFDSRRYGRRLSVLMPDQTADELLRLAASARVPGAAVIATPPPAPPRKRASERTRSRPLRRPARADRRHGHPPGRHAEWGFQGSGPAQLALARCCSTVPSPSRAAPTWSCTCCRASVAACRRRA